MEIPGSLQTVSEVSIAFAGFSGLIVLFRKKAGPLTDVEKYRLKVLLTLAFGAMFLAFMPELIQYFGAPAKKLWILASCILSIYSMVFLIWWIAASRQLMKSVPEIFNWFAISRMAVGHIVVVLLQFGVVFSLIEQSSIGVYIAALLWYLVHAAQQFTRMLFFQPKSA